MEHILVEIGIFRYEVEQQTTEKCESVRYRARYESTNYNNKTYQKSVRCASFI